MGLPAFVVYGDDAGDFAAWSLGSGDLDGDGYGDLAIGCLLADGLANAGNGRGEVDVLFGGSRDTFLPGGIPWAAYDLGGGVSSARVLRLHGEADGHSFGDCSLIADVDQDGWPTGGDHCGARGRERGRGPHPWAGLVPSWHPSASLRIPQLRAGVWLTRFTVQVVRFGDAAVGDPRRRSPDVLTGANQARGPAACSATGRGGCLLGPHDLVALTVRFPWFLSPLTPRWSPA
jgi:hypothetical protein